MTQNAEKGLLHTGPSREDSAAGGKSAATVPRGSDKRHPARILGLDGKSYPGAWLSADDRTQLVGIVHTFSHDNGLSVRQIIARLADDYGIRRSVGWTSTVLRTWKCPGCSGGANVHT